MKFSTLTSRSFLLLTWLLLSFHSIAAPPSRAPDTAKHFVLASHEWAPFASRQTRFFGIIPRITSELLHSQGIEVKYRFMHWSDTLDGIISEEFDGALVWVMDDLRHESFLISDPIMKYRSALYYRRDFPKPTTSNDLLGFRMGINSHYVYDRNSYHLLKKGLVKPIQASNDVEHFQNLIDGKIDFYLSPLVTSKPLLESNFPPAQYKTLAYSSSVFKFPATHLIINRHREGSLEFMQNFNAGLQRLQRNGTIDRYIEDLRFSKY